MRSALRRSLAAGLIAALFGLLGRAQPDGAAPKIAILEASPGKVSQGDGQIVDEPIGISTWMGLYQDGDAYRWRTTQVRITGPRTGSVRTLILSHRGLCHTTR